MRDLSASENTHRLQIPVPQNARHRAPLVPARGGRVGHKLVVGFGTLVGSQPGADTRCRNPLRRTPPADLSPITAWRAGLARPAQFRMRAPVETPDAPCLRLKAHVRSWARPIVRVRPPNLGDRPEQRHPCLCRRHRHQMTGFVHIRESAVPTSGCTWARLAYTVRSYGNHMPHRAERSGPVGSMALPWRRVIP